MKTTIIKKEALLALSFLVGVGVVACDENVHDFGKQTGSEPSIYAYIADKEEEIVFNLSYNSETGELSGPAVKVQFPVHLTEPAKTETKITLDVDNGLIPIYNTFHEKGYLPLEGSHLDVKDDTLTIPEGETSSKDSITVTVIKPMEALTSTQGYLIPVKIRNFDGADVGIDYEKRRSYIVINVSEIQTPEE